MAGIAGSRTTAGRPVQPRRIYPPTNRLISVGIGNKGYRWGTSGPFGIVTMPLDKALNYIATEPAFWIHA